MQGWGTAVVGASVVGYSRGVSHSSGAPAPAQRLGAAANQPFRPYSRLFYEAPPLLLGAGGMLHRAWATSLSGWEIPHVSFSRKDLDLSRPETIAPAVPGG